MSNYASHTTVTADRSRSEIEQTLTRFGADQFLYGWDNEQNAAVVQFRAKGRMIRFTLPLPDKDDERFTLTPTGRRRRDGTGALKEWEKATRSVWRSLALVIKAKLVAVEDGITEFEEEFLAQIVLPDNTTVGTWVLPQVERAYEIGEMPMALPMGGK